MDLRNVRFNFTFYIEGAEAQRILITFWQCTASKRQNWNSNLDHGCLGPLLFEPESMSCWGNDCILVCCLHSSQHIYQYSIQHSVLLWLLFSLLLHFLTHNWVVLALSFYANDSFLNICCTIPAWVALRIPVFLCLLIHVLMCLVFISP